MIVDDGFTIGGPKTARVRPRPLRPAFLISTEDGARAAVEAACLMWGGLYCHMIPLEPAGTVAEPWAEYLAKTGPDLIYVEGGVESLTGGLPASLGSVSVFPLDEEGEDDESPPRLDGWRWNPSVTHVLDRMAAGGAALPLFADVARQRPADEGIGELQVLARFGQEPEQVTRFVGWAEGPDRPSSRLDTAQPGAFLIQWLLGSPLASHGEPVRTPLQLTELAMWRSGQSLPQHPRDTEMSLWNVFVVVGEEDSVHDFCAVWNLRANRPGNANLPVWLTPSQLQSAPVLAALAKLVEVEKTEPRFGYSSRIDGADRLSLLSSTIDTCEIAQALTAEGIASLGWEPWRWPDFIDRRVEPYFSERDATLFFDRGEFTFFPERDDVHAAPPYEAVADISIPAFQPGPIAGRTGLGMHQLTVRGDLMVRFANRGSQMQNAEVHTGTVPEVIRGALTDAGYRVGKNHRLAALTAGLRDLLQESRFGMSVLRARPVQDCIRAMAAHQSNAERSPGRFVPRSGLTAHSLRRFFPNDHERLRLLEWMVASRLVFRGLEVQCAFCGTASWYPLDDLANEFVCVGCRRRQVFAQSPSESVWSYQANEQIATAMDQGVLAQVLTAFALDGRVQRDRSESYFVANTVIERDGAEVEIDLFGFSGGEWMIAECKSSASPQLTEVERLREVAESVGNCNLYLGLRSDAEVDRRVASLVDLVVRWDVRSGADTPMTASDAVAVIERA